MHRDDAQTQSHTLIRVLKERVTLEYTPAAPCRQVPAVVHALTRSSRGVD